MLSRECLAEKNLYFSYSSQRKTWLPFPELTPLPLVWVPMHLSLKFLFHFPVHFQPIIFLDLTVVSPMELLFKFNLFGSHDTRLLDSGIPHGCAPEPFLLIGAFDEQLTFSGNNCHLSGQLLNSLIYSTLINVVLTMCQELR